MLSTSLRSAFIALLAFNTAFATPSPTGSYLAAATGVMTSEGCYSSSGDMTNAGSYEWQSSLWCQKTCLALKKPVLGLQDGGNCWCGDSLPATNTEVSTSECNVGCFGYNEACGGTDTWTVWLTGYSDEVAIYGSSGSSSVVISSSSTSDAPSSTSAPASAASTSTSTSPSATSTSAPSSSADAAAASSATTAASSVVVTSSIEQATIVQVQTVTVGGSVKTVMGTTVISSAVAVSTLATTNDQHSSGSSSKAGIAAGVVVGVIALLALVGGVVFYLKRRSKKAKENTHRRHTSLDAFVGAAGRNQAIAGGVRASTMNDSRLDPRIMVERRQSAGSVFADNVDYSRRILKVANPDDS